MKTNWGITWAGDEDERGDEGMRGGWAVSQWPIRRQEPDRGEGKTAQLSDGGHDTSVWSQIRLYASVKTWNQWKDPRLESTSRGRGRNLTRRRLLKFNLWGCVFDVGSRAHECVASDWFQSLLSNWQQNRRRLVSGKIFSLPYFENHVHE